MAIRMDNKIIKILYVEDEIESRNKQENRQYKLLLCTGKAYYDTEELCTIEELINRAKESMIEQKKIKWNHDSYMEFQCCTQL